MKRNVIVLTMLNHFVPVVQIQFYFIRFSFKKTKRFLKQQYIKTETNHLLN